MIEERNSNRIEQIGSDDNSVKILDISSTGMAFLSGAAIDVGTLLECVIDGNVVIAKVENCRDVGSGFRVGLYFKSAIPGIDEIVDGYSKGVALKVEIKR